MTCSYDNTVTAIFIISSAIAIASIDHAVMEASFMVGRSLIITVFGMKWRKSERADFFWNWKYQNGTR